MSNISSIKKNICTGCGACVSICPHNAIIMKEIIQVSVTAREILGICDYILAQWREYTLFSQIAHIIYSSALSRIFFIASRCSEKSIVPLSNSASSAFFIKSSASFPLRTGMLLIAIAINNN